MSLSQHGGLEFREEFRPDVPNEVAGTPPSVPILERGVELGVEADLPVGDPALLDSFEEGDTMGGSGRGSRRGPDRSDATRRTNVLLACWDAVCAAVIGVPLGTPKVRPGAAAWHRGVREKIGKMSRHRGVDSVVADLKVLSAECRRAWVEHSTPAHWALKSMPLYLRRSQSAWAQLSMLGRALPSGTDRQEEEALARHQRDLTSSEFLTDPDSLMSIKKFATDWAVSYLPRDVDFAATMGLPMGNSATYAKTRAEGGLSADVADLLELEPYLEPEVQDGMPPGQGALINEIRVVGAAYADEWHAHPKGRVAIIRERGHKVRIVTAMSRHALVLGHLARRRLEKGLRKWSLTRHVYEGEPREVGREFVGSTGRVVSSDLRAASDLIPLDVARAIVDGFEESDRFLPCELDGLRLGTGPVEVTWPNGETHVTNRGLLMGLPTTWSMLCVYHGWAWQQAQSCPLNSRGAKGITARICGDDLLGVAPPGCDPSLRVSVAG
jgi:hypothetical protein